MAEYIFKKVHHNLPVPCISCKESKVAYKVLLPIGGDTVKDKYELTLINGVCRQCYDELRSDFDYEFQLADLLLTFLSIERV